MTAPQPSTIGVEPRDDVPALLSNASVIWCTCGNAAGGARVPSPNCALHSGLMGTMTWTLRA